MLYLKKMKKTIVVCFLSFVYAIVLKQSAFAYYGEKPEQLYSYQYWGNQLDEYERRIYDEMLKDALRSERKELVLEYGFEHIWELGEDGISSYVSNLVARAYSAFTYDYPLYRPASYSYEYSLTGNTMILTISFEEFYDSFWEDMPQVRTGIDKLEEKILQNFARKFEQPVDEDSEIIMLEEGNETDTFLLLEEIYLTVIEQLTYSFSISGIADIPTDLETYSVSAAVLEQFGHHTVCSGYSGLFQILCNDLGVSCIQVCNDGTDAVNAHSYNFVQIGMDWYMVDATWGDFADTADWTSFLCGDKVSLDGRKLGNRLANQYVTSGFTNPNLKDCFYYSLETKKDTEERQIVYDACRDFEGGRSQFDVTTSPYSRAVLENLEIEAEGTQVFERNSCSIIVKTDQSCDFQLIFSNRYFDRNPEKEYSVFRYPEYTLDERGMHLYGLTPLFTFEAIPKIFAENYFFTFEGSGLVFTMKQEEYALAVQTEEAFSLEYSLIFPEEGNEEEMAFGICFSDWNEVLKKGVFRIDLQKDPEFVKLEKRQDCKYYVLGISGNGRKHNLGLVSVDEAGIMELRGEYQTYLFSETEWKTETDYRTWMILIVGCVAVFAVLFALYCKKRRHRKHISTANNK